ncbi:MAG TPA: DUF3159 domain-containing protein [Micromonosporaceae bacterium]|jgi:hypothetical protein
MTAQDASDEVVPTFSEQLADQLGGVRGLIESGVPVVVFVIANILGPLKLAIIIAVASAVLIAIFRLARRQTVRNAINGLFGIAIGAIIAWKTGSTKDFYLPGIIVSGLYGVAMLISVPFRRPLVGWVWSLLAAGGSMRWREQPKLVRLFSRLTVLWALTYLVKVGIQAVVFQHTSSTDPGTALGIARLLLGYPPYVALLAFTAWSVRRLTQAHPELAEAAQPLPSPAELATADPDTRR